jgi:hypothetical protein
MPVILGTWESEIRRIVVQNYPTQIVREILSQKKKKKSQKRAGAVAQGVGPEFKPQYHKKKKKVKALDLSQVRGTVSVIPNSHIS